MYLKHLLQHRGLTVYDARSNKVVFWADETIVLEFIKANKIRPVGPRKCIRRLEWIGRELSTVSAIEQEFGESYSSSPAFGPRKYSHNRERISTEQRSIAPFDENPRGVWTMVRLPDSTQVVFLEVAIQCGARMLKRRSNLGAKPSRVIDTASFARTQKRF